MIPKKIQTWQMTQPWSEEGSHVIPGRIEQTEIDVPPVQSGDVLVEIAGCGVCHTDLGFFYDGVPTIQKAPLTLGHEISGRVIAGDSELFGREVIIPSVMPCNNCPICAQDRGNRCLHQKMPGNSMGIYGGYSSHIVVPEADLCVVKDRDSMPLEYLAVIADAISTPYQATVRADIKPGDRTIVIGAGGGVGNYVMQLCRALGAEAVIAIDIVEDKLELALKFGATHTINAKGKTEKDVKADYKAICKQNGWPSHYDWKIFEVSGTKCGQAIGLELLSFVSKLILIGFGCSTHDIMISRLMALDAEVIGTWACPPKYYPKVLDMVLTKQIEIKPFVETRPMSTVKEVFEEIHHTAPTRRVVLTPDF
ncbi:MAG TPA: 6-hydroxycyclohex-1-ene-1-carbonyl-CoA dehydrogenase [Thermodesulfobacteriota bacterium]|nr:6-hydroxycyclohex-1-ene-1-carbonyl-CoA dehydrogenase [Thermodesulfobacteriota bacterium]